MCSDLHDIIDTLKMLFWLYVAWHVVKFIWNVFVVGAWEHATDKHGHRAAARTSALERADLAQREAAVIERLKREGKW